MKIGFIGLGRMGAAMAANLVRAGHDVTVFNRSPGKSAPLVELGAREAAHLADACAASAVISMLANDEAASDIALGEGGIIDHLPQGRDPRIDEHDQRGALQTLGAGARESGTTLCRSAGIRPPGHGGGGKAIHRRRGRPRRRRCVSAAVRRDGSEDNLIGTEPSAANLVKLSGNFLLASAIEALGEAVALIGKAGIDPRAYIEFLTSTVFNVPAYKTYGAPHRASANSSPRRSPRRSDTRTSVSRWPRPRVCAYPCRSEACCMTGFCACSPRAASISIGPRSADWLPRMRRPEMAFTIGWSQTCAPIPAPTLIFPFCTPSGSSQPPPSARMRSTLALQLQGIEIERLAAGSAGGQSAR